MKIRYDEKSDAVYIKFKESKYFESDEVKDGVILDYDRKGKIIGIEILDASRYMMPADLASVQFDVHRIVNSSRSKRAVH